MAKKIAKPKGRARYKKRAATVLVRLLKPSTQSDWATIDIMPLDDQSKVRYRSLFAKASYRRLKLELRIDSDEELTVEARQRLRRNLLVTTT
jgi:hypothetical protein